MFRTERSNARARTLLLGTALVLIAASPALAGGGNVLPPTAQPKGYSLADAAAAEAYFNTGDRSPGTLPQDFPFVILNRRPTGNTFVVSPGTMFYVPLVWFDDSPPIIGNFPDVTDPEAVAHYYFDPDQLGAVSLEIAVDGVVTELTPGYVAGAVVPGLPTGGNNYTVAAAFLTPLSKGTHTVSIHGLFAGKDLLDFPDFFPDGIYNFSVTYTVIVR